MSAQLKALAKPIELLDHRTMHGKTFLLPDGRVHISSCVRPFHWNDNGAWVDVDNTPRSEDGEMWTTRSTPYEMSWDSERLELAFRNKRGGEVKIRLVALDDVPIYRAISGAKVSGNSVKVLAAPELEIELRCRTHNVEIFKILHGPKAPRKLTWSVLEGSPGCHTRLMETTGHDNLLSSAARKLGDKLNRRRAVEIKHSRSHDGLMVTEEFTGRTRFIDPVTRARSWVNEVEWPVEIDVTVSVSVTADQDDGHGREYDYWRATGATNLFLARADEGAPRRYAAARFLSVNVPQGQTLDSATFTVNVVVRGGSQSGTLSGQNVDTAPTWANAAAFSPKTMAATTANVSVAVPGATGLLAIDVKTICQEIINRSGFAANNNMRLGWTTVSGMSTSYMQFEDVFAAGSSPAKLDITYTPSGGSANFLLGQGCM